MVPLAKGSTRVNHLNFAAEARGFRARKAFHKQRLVLRYRREGVNLVFRQLPLTQGWVGNVLNSQDAIEVDLQATTIAESTSCNCVEMLCSKLQASKQWCCCDIWRHYAFSQTRTKRGRWRNEMLL